MRALPNEHHIIKSMVLRFARKYVAGYTLDSALKQARENSNMGLRTTMTYLNDGVRDAVRARYNANAYTQLARQASRLHLNYSISLRLSQIGLNVDEQVLGRCMSDIVGITSDAGATTWVEAENGVSMDGLFNTYREYRKLGKVGLEIPIWYPLEVNTIKRHVRKGDIVKLTSYSYTADAAKDCRGGETGAGPSRVIGKKRANDKVKAKDREAKYPTNLIDLYISNIGKLLQAEASVAVLDHDEGTIAKLASFSREYKKSLIFELPLGYSKGWLKKLMKMKINLGVYVPYGKDWTPYIVNKVTASHGRISDIAAKVLDGQETSVADGKKGIK